MFVRITCSDESIAFEGEMEADSHHPILERAREEAVKKDMPIQVEIYGGGVWSITPDGRIMPGALFHNRPRKGGG